jgi:hypothetical protein
MLLAIQVSVLRAKPITGQLPGATMKRTFSILLVTSILFPVVSFAKVKDVQCAVVNYFTQQKIASIKMQKVGVDGQNPAFLGDQKVTSHLAIRAIIMDNDSLKNHNFKPDTYGQVQSVIQFVTVDKDGYIPDYAIFDAYNESSSSSEDSKVASKPIDIFQVKCLVTAEKPPKAAK